MIYTNEECIMLSLIFSEIEKGRFPKQVVDLKGLYSLFKFSLQEKLNIFDSDLKELEDLIERSIVDLKKNNPRIKEKKKEENLKDFFINNRSNFEMLRKQAKKEIDLCYEKKIKYFTYFSNEYPKSLKEIEEPPFVLFYKGYLPTEIELKKSLAVIGSRRPEKQYGKEVARKVGKKLSESGWWNISGLALGCDEYGHIGSLEANGLTGAILGHGLAEPIYPIENKELAEKIISKGGFLMSELPPSVKVSPLFFVLRDRLQSGITNGIFAVETPIKSGTLHTIKYSLEQNRNTFIWDPSDIKSIKNLEEVQGNLVLLGKEKNYKLNISIKASLKEKTIPIKDSKELLKYMDIIEKKIESSKSIEKKDTFKQELLF